MRNSNQILQVFLNRLLKMTKIINSSIEDGKKRGKNEKEILFSIQMILYETEVDLKDIAYMVVEDIFNSGNEVKLHKSIYRLELDSDCPELLFLN